jgi:hypothetical protein
LSGIAYRTCLPLGWRTGTVDEAQLAYSNIALLRALAIVESATPEREHEADSHLAKSMERLETKLDIVMSMLSRLSLQHVDIPPPVEVTLTSDTVEWSCGENAPRSGDTILISLYLSPKLPEALQLPAHVMTSTAGTCTAEITCKDAEFEEWLTRTLFRYHRRGLQARHHE